MADFSIVADVSAELLKLLRTQMCPAPVSAPESIRLAAPTDKNGDFQLGLYLYDLRELGEYRAGALQRGADNIRRRPPRPLTLHYLLFLNSKAQIATGAETEQRILGRAMQVLGDGLPHPGREPGPPLFAGAGGTGGHLLSDAEL